jgi:tetratricopeptide (TPR) repeat protein
MRIRSFPARAALTLLMAAAMCAVSASTASVLAQGGKSAPPNLSADEQKMIAAITAATDPAARLKAVEALIKKHPKTSARGRIAREAADQIGDLKDAAQKVTLAQQYAGIFTEPSEQQMIGPVLIEGLAAANRVDEAFASGAEFLTRNPDSLFVLVALMSHGTDQAKQKNTKFIPESLQYGTRAIELIEADKKPADIDDAGWKKYKSTALPSLYQSIGLLNLVKGDREGAKARLAKAAELAPTDAFNYLLLAGILNDEYQDAAKRYQSMPSGPPKDEELKKILAFLDQVIDAYAHTIALAEGNERLAPVRQQYLQDLEAYYKYRHNNSTTGMQQLIDKYKVPAKP